MRYEVITFDCYGTLIDWESGIYAAFSSEAARDGRQFDRDTLLRAYAAAEPQVEQETYRSYRDVLTETAMRVAQTLGWPLTGDRAQFLADSLPSWTPFPDTNPALERMINAGARLGLLSNTDDLLLAATRKHFTVTFEIIFTAQNVRSYKPAPAHFLAARNRIGNAPWLHAAQSDYHDIVPTNALAIDNAWINRKSEKPLPGGVPRYEFPDLTGLAALIES